MKKVKFVLASLSILIMVSCGKKETRSESESAIHPEEMQAGHEEIELNNGERWNVNEEMKPPVIARSEEHTSELQSRPHLVCRLLLEKKKQQKKKNRKKEK